MREEVVGDAANKVLAAMARSKRTHDESLGQYLARSHHPFKLRAWSRIHVEGFNAAVSDEIGTAALAEDAEAADEIDGDRSFRLPAGYDAIAYALLHAIPDSHGEVRLNSVVYQVRWRRGFAEVRCRSALDQHEATLRCAKLIVTVPLGVLQAGPPATGAIRFDPAPGGILKAAGALKFGHVYRISFRFREAFWDDDERLRRTGFLVSKDKSFFTWWTSHPVMAPVLTGWCAGSAAEALLGARKASMAEEALAALSRILQRRIPRPAAAYFHDWTADPFSRGAYSYVPPGALSARRTLGVPVEDTLYFAGEAANRNGHGGTVHGAIESGIRAARLVLKQTSTRLESSLL